MSKNLEILKFVSLNVINDYLLTKLNYVFNFSSSKS